MFNSMRSFFQKMTLCGNVYKKVSCSVKGKMIKLKFSQIKIPRLLVICGCQHSKQPLNCNRDPLHKYSKYFLLLMNHTRISVSYTDSDLFWLECHLMLQTCTFLLQLILMENSNTKHKFKMDRIYLIWEPLKNIDILNFFCKHTYLFCSFGLSLYWTKYCPPWCA